MRKCLCAPTHMGTTCTPVLLQKGKKYYKSITCEHIHTEQKLMCCSCNPLRFLSLCISIILSSMDQSFSLFIPLPANAHIGVSCCQCTQTYTHVPHSDTPISVGLLVGSGPSLGMTAWQCLSSPKLTPQAPPAERIYT